MWRSKHRRNMFKHKCGGASTEAEKRAEKGRGRVKEELIKLHYLNSTHHRGVEFHVPFYIIWMWLCSFWWSKLDYTFITVGLSFQHVCVCVGGGGGLLTPFFYLQIAKRGLCGLVALANSCRGKKDLSTITKT